MSRYLLKKIILYGSVYVLLGISNLLIKLVPFKKLVRFLSNTDTAAQAVLTPKKAARLDWLRRAIVSVGRRTPWRSMCFEQAITASLILRILGISYQINFGLNTDNEKLKAHAWLKVNGIWITGYMTSMDFTAVSEFYYTSTKDRVAYV